MVYTTPLIQTKLHRPIIPVDLVPRPQLTDWLDERRNRPVTLVSAPAGYGKSTLISSWLDTCNYANTWLSLDAQDNDLIGFLTYFLAAIRVIFPEAAKNTQALLAAGSQAPIKELAISLVNDINQLDEFVVLVLDDFEVIQEHLVHDFLNEFLLHPPRGFHLVICTRIDPFLSIQKLRAKSQLTEIRAQDLRFSVEESYTFLKKVLGTSIDIATVQYLDEQSEGWVTGLRLAALALRHRVGNQSINVKPTADNQYVLDYLMSEILDHQSAVLSEWLLKTSILARFNAGLCEAVCIAEDQGAKPSEEAYPLDGDDFLKWLVSSNLFTISLDDYNQWVRYHNLFRDFLQEELVRRYDRTEIDALHIRASEWFAEQGLINEALQHALEAGDLSAAARLIEQNGPALLNEDKWYTLKKWLAKLPDDIVQQRPMLLLARAWVLYHHFTLHAIPPVLETIEKILGVDATTQPIWGEVDFFWGHHWFWQGQTAQSLELFNRSLERIPRTSSLARSDAELFWGLANQMSGRENDAVQQLNQWLYYNQALTPGHQTKLLGSLAFIYLLTGELNEATRVVQQIQELAAKYDNLYILAWTSYLEGMIHYFRNDLKNAARCFDYAVKNRYVLHNAAAVDSLAGLALTYQALVQPESAEATMAQLHEFSQEIYQPANKTIACSCQARLSLLQGDLISAIRWISLADLNTDRGIMFYFLEIPRLTDCRVLIAKDTSASLAEATQKLKGYEQQNINEHNTHQLIDILLLQAQAYQKQSQSDQALGALARAITLAEPGGWIRPFLELGTEMVQHLTRLVDKQGSTKYINKILAVFEPEGNAAGDISAPPSSQLIEPLTQREFEILELLGKRMTNKEIAAELYISVGTVQQHLNHIYAKLNVKGRREAIAKAKALALLPTPN
jgi:LuxR family maltose regulon positive regulatory protein